MRRFDPDPRLQFLPIALTANNDKFSRHPLEAPACCENRNRRSVLPVPSWKRLGQIRLDGTQLGWRCRRALYGHSLHHVGPFLRIPTRESNFKDQST
jgi:hypothetical protein